MRNFKDDRHNLYVGWVAGMAIKHGMRFEFVPDEMNNYTDRLRLHLEWGTLEVVIPYPPDGWTVDAGYPSVTDEP